MFPRAPACPTPAPGSSGPVIPRPPHPTRSFTLSGFPPFLEAGGINDTHTGRLTWEGAFVFVSKACPQVDYYRIVARMVSLGKRKIPAMKLKLPCGVR